MPSYLDDLIKKAKDLKEEEELEAEKPVKKKKALKKKGKVPETNEMPKELRKELERGLFEPKIRKPVETKEEPEPLAEINEKDVKEERQDPSVEEELEAKSKKEIASYGDVRVFKVKKEPMLYYHIPVRKPTGGERTIINTIKEAATRIISIAPYRIRDPEQRRNVYKQKVLEIFHSSPELNIPERRFDFYAESVVREMVGYGLIDPLIRDDKLEEIMVIGPLKPVYVFHREYEMMKTNIEFFSDNEITDLINRIAREVGRRVDISTPLLDARLADGSRVNATIPPASISGATLTIRKFRKDPYSIIDLIKFNTLDEKTAAFLWMAVDGLGVKPANMLISGGTGSGKTTTLNVLASFIPSRERIVTIEDTAELNLPLNHFISLEARPPGLEGTGELTLDMLTKNALRMRPDRIIVGEVRHDEAFSLFTAMNTGHDGCLGTVHANSPQETIVRVTSPPMNVPGIMMSGLDLILVEHRIHDKKKGTIRRITEIAEVGGALEGRTACKTLFERDPVDDEIHRTGIPSVFLNTLQKFTGYTKKQMETELEEREDFLKNLVKKDIRNLGEVSKQTQLYFSQKGTA